MHTSPLSIAQPRTRFVLVAPSHPGNVGAAARALRVMGFDDLVLVAPREADALRHPDAIAFASNATDVLAKARTVGRFEDALEGIATLCATAMTPRDFGPPTLPLRAACAELAPRSTDGVAFVFGCERYGLPNAVVHACHLTLSIPTAPDYGSLNLAQAVQLVAYEWRSLLGFPAPAGASDGTALAPVAAPLPAPEGRASAAAVQGALAHWQGTLERLGFLDPRRPKKLMPRLNQLLNRAQPSVREVDILRGIAAQIDARLGRADAANPNAARQDAASARDAAPRDSR